MLCVYWIVIYFGFVIIWILCFDFSFFFFKQKTAYEMRISDWSSDVCSSDLSQERDRDHQRGRGRHRKPGLGADVAPHVPALGPAQGLQGRRSEERRVGKECVSTCRSRWSPYH